MFGSPFFNSSQDSAVSFYELLLLVGMFSALL